MSRNTASTTPGLATFLRSVSSEPVENSIESFISLLRRRQIRGSKACAIATAHLLRRTISLVRASEPGKLIHRVLEVGKRLVAAAPRELAIGNVIRRVLGLIRDEEEENRADDLSRATSEAGSEPHTPAAENTLPGYMSPLLSNGTSVAPRRDQEVSARPPLLSSHTGIPGGARPVTSMFSILSHPTMRSGVASPAVRSGSSTPLGFQQLPPPTDLRAEILEGISEIIDELEQSDEQIANYALEHILPTETILTYSSSMTVQRFLLKAASKRKFTVIHAESHPNSYLKTHSLVTGNPPMNPEDEAANMSTESFQKPLIAAGITVLLIPDSAIFALMPRVQKVILSAHAVMSNGSILANSGTKAIIQAAKFHRVLVVVLAATYKLSAIYPYDRQSLIEYGDVAKVIPYQDRELREGLKGVRNPLVDFVDGEGNIDLFVTNVGSVATSYMYKVVKDQYRDEDVQL